MIMTEIPVRLCCGQRHTGSVCPDGKVMCCICFELFEVEDLNTAASGIKEDVCIKCAEIEKHSYETNRPNR